MEIQLLSTRHAAAPGFEGEMHHRKMRCTTGRRAYTDLATGLAARHTVCARLTRGAAKHKHAESAGKPADSPSMHASHLALLSDHASSTSPPNTSPVHRQALRQAMCTPPAARAALPRRPRPSPDTLLRHTASEGRVDSSCALTAAIAS